MGVLASHIVLDASGACIANAYVALARNEMRMYPQGEGLFFVNTAFDIWNSYPDRVQGRQPLETRVLRYDYVGNAMPVTIYDVAYDRIKAIFPGCEDLV
jgi:hypothetical protein